MLKHFKISSKGDGADPSLVQPSDWNADHVFTGDVTLPANLIVTGKIGIGHAPAYPLDIVNNQNAATVAIIANNNAGNAAQAYWSIDTTASVMNMGICGPNFTPAGLLFQGASFLISSANLVLGVTTPGGAILFGTENTEKMRLGPKGNLGIGIQVGTSWATNYRTVTLGPGASLIGIDYGGPTSTSAIALMTNNGYYDGSTWRASTNAPQGLYGIQDGQHIWYTGNSATAAGLPFNFLTRMKLKENGQLVLNQQEPYFSGSGPGFNSTVLVQLAGGLIFQCGTAAGGGGSTSITLPITFPNAIMCAWANANMSAPVGGANVFASAYPNDAGHIAAVTNSAGYACEWFAVGW